MQRESLNETREQSRQDKGEDGEKKMRPPPLRAKEKKRKKKVMCKNKDKTRFSIRKVCEIEQEDLTELFVGAIEEKQTGNKVEMQVTKVTDAMVLKKNKWTETLKVNKKHFILNWIWEQSAT